MAASFTYEYKDYQSTEQGISLAANSIHSVDGYIMRSMVRRCNYDKEVITIAYRMLESELDVRTKGNHQNGTAADKVQKYIDLYLSTNIADIVILPHLIKSNDWCVLDTDHIKTLSDICHSMLQHEPFEIITIHDSFASHPNNLNHLRQHYINILAELADSTLLQSIMNEITNNPTGKYKKHSSDLGKLIRQSNYAIC